MAVRRAERRQAVSEHKRALILEAAREVFAAEGLEGASLRAIATRAGYTPAALYFHFDSKETIYAEVLRGSLAALGRHVDEAVQKARGADSRLRAAAMAFFRFYAERPRDLDLGFYLLRGGMRPKGLGRERDEALNANLEAALRPIADAAQALGAPRSEAELLMVDTFAHATGVLLLLHTGRIRMFGASASERMETYVDDSIGRLTRGGR
ncbi:TetR/AcrR family transcriptional regulator [Methylorubrum thiocyanatum]|jgi:AcrR family transcriptional regulator|uniref:AcrR family transcriptional regulator n=1 Tax=Methylorubrum thiocyanatum TaxID=47958 RepID=A0AA40S5T6_9HYPH|nr:TetR/AcrR family transcriptional regulator [Methylorubrum thiocyanatum]MBA8915084.1 AcrR family transcriptional regulator [Methylorubrum thiocyanatum]GJE79488.1 HTH-type transcriptional regulator BetI [Methylorubrum thiocyanatum]